MTLSTAHGFALRLAQGTCVWGWALAMQEQEEEGLAQIHQGLNACEATGTELGRPRQLDMLAEAYGKAGQANEGLSILAEALAHVDKTGEHYYEAELHRLKVELLLLQSSNNHLEAETCFHQAISIAQNQSAKSWELRSVTSLSRLWQSQGKRAEAQQLLSEIYGWFTEGFDTADLKDAKALLEELA